MLDKIREKFDNFIPLANAPNDTSKAYKVDGHIGQVGFITSMTEHFCGSCNRLRITADGNLKVYPHRFDKRVYEFPLNFYDLFVGLSIWKHRNLIERCNPKWMLRR